jgi:peptidoglycan/xylan/chitin deacetylase (PgdA/CDA1 family)
LRRRRFSAEEIGRMLSRVFLAVSVVLLGGCAATEQPAGETFQVAITVDDLTVHGALPPGATRQQVADRFIAAFKAHGVEEAWGFINGVQVEREPDSAGVLAAWRTAGHPLGNHGYSHMNAAENTAEAFVQDIAGNEPLLRRYMGDQHWRWLRFPFLNAGSDQNHEAIMRAVADRGYRVADVSISFNDWAYSDAYARCASKGDAAAIALLRERYMADVAVSIERSRALSKKLYGRDIPYVLLIHVGAFTGEMLPQVLDAFEKAGAGYTRLETAQADPAYADTGPKAGQGMMLERVAEAKGVSMAGLPALNDVNAIMQTCQ